MWPDCDKLKDLEKEKQNNDETCQEGCIPFPFPFIVQCGFQVLPPQN